MIPCGMRVPVAVWLAGIDCELLYPYTILLLYYGDGVIITGAYTCASDAAC